MVWPPSGARWGLAGSFDGDFAGLARPISSFMSLAVRRSGDLPVLTRFLELSSVDYVVALHDPRVPGLQEVARFDSVYAEPIRLLRVTNTLPRSYVVGRGRIASGRAATRAVFDPGFDYRREVVVNDPGPPLPAQPDFTGTARITRHMGGRVELDVETSGPGYLVLTEAYDRRWQATIDGRPTDVWIGNLLFRCIRVPEGRHRVRFDYQPGEVLWGALVSALAAAAGLLAWERGRLDKRRRVHQNAGQGG
jgi:hypothetical protein